MEAASTQRILQDCLPLVFKNCPKLTIVKYGGAMRWKTTSLSYLYYGEGPGLDCLRPDHKPAGICIA